MRPIAPRLGVGVEVNVAEDQPAYLQITAAMVPVQGNEMEAWCRWTFTPEERACIAAGEDIYIGFPRQVAPHVLTLRPDWGKD